MENKFRIPDRLMPWIRRALVVNIVFVIFALAYYIQGLVVHYDVCRMLEVKYPEETFSISPLGCMVRAPHGMTDGYYWRSVEVVYDLDSLAELYK